MNSPVGSITLLATESALVSLQWGRELARIPAWPRSADKRNAILPLAEAQLKEYFEGKRSCFDIPLAPAGTEFQKRAWAELLSIPHGQTITYGEQAKRMGRPKSTRAVGAANGKNPIGIIIPCHRVIGASGDLIGFAGGLETKRLLLGIEGIRFAGGRA